MESDHYIKNLMANIKLPIKKSDNQTVDQEELTLLEKSRNDIHFEIPAEITNVIDEIKLIEIKGQKKRLIRIHDDAESILKLLYPAFKIDVQTFINFLLIKFFEDNPSLIAEIKKSVTKL